MASKTPKGWSEQRQSDFKFRFRVSLATCAVYFVTGYKFFPFQLPVMDSVTERLIFTIRWQMFGAFTLFMGMMGVIRIRGSSDATADPIKGNAEHFTQLARNILQNTVEQFIIHFIGQIILCTYLSSESMKVIPLLVVLFVIARIVYKIGYESEAMRRSYGFVSTFIPTLIVYGYCFYCILMYGPAYGLQK